MTLTGDEVKRNIGFDPLTGYCVRDVVDTLAKLADKQSQIDEKHGRLITELFENATTANAALLSTAAALADKVAALDKRLTSVRLLSVQGEARLAKRIATLEQAQATDLNEPPPVSPLPIVGHIKGQFVPVEKPTPDRLTATGRVCLEDGLTDHERRHQKLLNKVAANAAPMIREAAAAAVQLEHKRIMEHDWFAHADGCTVNDKETLGECSCGIDDEMERWVGECPPNEYHWKDQAERSSDA